MIEVLTNDHYETIMGLFRHTTKRVRIVSPFLTESMADRLCEAVREKRIECVFITRLYVQDLLHKANTVDGLEKMVKAGIKVYAVKKLHTKLYLFDEDRAVLGSANFTSSGLRTNIELSLLFSGEENIVNNLNDYFSDLLERIAASGDGEVTPEILADSRARYLKLYKGNKGTAITTKSEKMYGASLEKGPLDVEKELELCRSEHDMVFDMFRETEVIEEIRYDHTIWLKFAGEANDRINGTEYFPLVQVVLDGKRMYVQNYPKRPESVKDGDEVYLAALTTDNSGKNQPVIVGRGHLRGFRPTNHVNESWLQERSWMARYPWFCVMEDCEILNTNVSNGIPLDAICMKLGSDTYLASFGRNEDIPTVAQKHYQKAHLRLSGNAKRLIDKLFDELARKYGTQKSASERE